MKTNKTEDKKLPGMSQAKVLETILKLESIDAEIAKLQEEKAKIRMDLFKKLGDKAERVVELPEAIEDGKKYAKLKLDFVITERYEAKVTFYKKDPTEG